MPSYDAGMDIQGVADEIAREWSVIESAPWLFTVSIAIVVFGAWKAMAWRYAGTIETLEHRLKLRDDTITHLEKNASVAVAISKATGSVIDVTRSIDPPETRLFVGDAVTVEYLTDLYVGRNNIQGDKLAQPYIGKWIQVSGTVEIMTGLGAEATTITATLFSVGQKALSAWMVFPKQRDQLEIIKPSGTFTAIGKIQGITSYEVKLLDCELL